ncbi:hypothetical protein ROZALSC1DRAFT_25619, partial [Rozella allomycis CSF55]
NIKSAVEWVNIYLSVDLPLEISNRFFMLTNDLTSHEIFLKVIAVFFEVIQLSYKMDFGLEEAKIIFPNLFKKYYNFPPKSNVIDLILYEAKVPENITRHEKLIILANATGASFLFCRESDSEYILGIYLNEN